MSKSLPYRPDIDGLRGIAVIGVVLYHAGFLFPGGYVGVDVFFVISGFLITNLILKDLQSNSFSFLSFWERRARRILPALVTVVAFTLVAGYILLLPPDYRTLGTSVLALIALSSNVKFWLGTGYFQPEAEENPLLHTWSLSLEEQFYLLIPILLWALHRFSKVKWFTLLIGLLCLVSFVFSVLLIKSAPSATFYLLPSRAWEMAAGSLLVIVPTISSAVMRKSALWLGFLGIMIPFLSYTEKTQFPGLAALPPVLGSVLVIWAGMGSEGLSFRTGLLTFLTSKPVVGVGLMSYSLYLWHWPFLAFNRYLNVWHDSDLVRAGLLMASLLMAWLSLHYVERPFRSKNWISSQKSVFTVSVVALAVITAPALFIWRTNGMPERLSELGKNYASTTFDTQYVRELSVEEIPSGFLNLGLSTGKPTVFVWGDSHGMAILPAIHAACLQRSISAQAATHSSTAPVLGWFAKTRFGLNEKAPAYNQMIMDYLESPSARQSLTHIVLVAYWEGYLDRQANQTGFQEALVQTFQRLRNCGYEVILFDQVPNWSSNVPRALALQELIGWDVLRLRPAGPLSNTAGKGIYAILSESTMTLNHLKVFDPRPYFTNEQGLPIAADEKGAFFRDAQHLTTHGALRLQPAFIELFAHRGL